MKEGGFVALKNVLIFVLLFLLMLEQTVQEEQLTDHIQIHKVINKK